MGGKAHTNRIVFHFVLSYWLYGWFKKNKKLDGFKLAEFDVGFMEFILWQKPLEAKLIEHFKNWNQIVEFHVGQRYN